MKRCSVKECARSYFCRGFCSRHYLEARKSGLPKVRTYDGICKESQCTRRKYKTRGTCYRHLPSEVKEAHRKFNREYLASRPSYVKRRYEDYYEKIVSDPRTYLLVKYNKMFGRVRGKGPKHNRHYYKGLPIMPKDDFVSWSLHDPQFVRLFRTWQLSGRCLLLTPVPDRIDSDNGYVLKNIEWVTFSENSRRAAELAHSRRWS